MTYAVVTVFTPGPEHRAALVASMRRWGRVARSQPGLLWTGVVDDEGGRLVGTAVWESPEAARAAAPALRAEVGNDPFAAWEAAPTTTVRGTVLEEGGRLLELDDPVDDEADDDEGADEGTEPPAAGEAAWDEPATTDEEAEGDERPAGGSGTASAALRSTFLPVVRFRDGYDIDEVDAFLERVKDALDRPGTGGDGLTPRDVATASFTTTSLRRGYDVVAVDRLLGRLAGSVQAPSPVDVAPGADVTG